MLQHLLRRLVFDVPILNEYAKMPLKVRESGRLYDAGEACCFSL